MVNNKPYANYILYWSAYYVLLPGNETHTERESGTQKGRARGQSVRGVGIFRLLTGVCEMQILGVTIVTT